VAALLKKRDALEPSCDEWAAPSHALMSAAITRILSGYDCLRLFWWDMFSFLATTDYVITSRSELSLMLHRETTSSPRLMRVRSVVFR
jgi:hypothetical protein